MFKEKLFQWNWIPEPLYPDFRKNLQPVFSDVSQKKSTVKLKSYSGEGYTSVRPNGSVGLVHQQEETSTLLVVKGDSCSLFGKNWFSCITLDWKDIHQVMNSSLKTVLDHHSAVFQERLGKLKDYKAWIHKLPHVFVRQDLCLTL